MKRNISRRNWLKALGLGSACASLVPWLETSSARADEEAPPLRLVLFFNPNGTVPTAWAPIERKSETEFELNTIHRPLEKYRGELVLFGGLDNRVASDPGNHGGPHQRGIGALFTGERLRSGEFADGCGATAGFANGESIDQAVARLIGKSTPFSSLEFGVHCLENDVQGRISYAGPAQPLPPENSPREAFRRLVSGVTATASERTAIQRGLVSNYVHEEFAFLKKRVSRSDAERLDAHEGLLNDLEGRLGVKRDFSGACSNPKMPADFSPFSEADMEPISHAQLDLLALSLACDLTRVGSVQYSTGFNKTSFPFLDNRGEGHLLSHSGDSNLGAWDAMTVRATWHAAQIAYFLDRLSSYEEAGGSVRTRTLVLWGSEVAKGNSHSLTDIPLLSVGTLDGKLRGGRAFELGGRSHTDLLLSVARAFGSSRETFGAPEFSEGIIEEFFT